MKWKTTLVDDYSHIRSSKGSLDQIINYDKNIVIYQYVQHSSLCATYKLPCIFNQIWPLSYSLKLQFYLCWFQHTMWQQFAWLLTDWPTQQHTISDRIISIKKEAIIVRTAVKINTTQPRKMIW